MPSKCDHCGAATEIPESFFRERKSFRKTIRTLCPTCWTKHTASIFSRFLIFQLAPGPIGLAIILLAPHESLGWMLFNLFILQVLMILCILPHEWGHAWAAKSARWCVYRIYIGFGKALFTRKVFGFATEFRPVPLGGLVIAAPRSAHRFWAYYFAFVLAGPLTTGAMMVVGLLLVGFDRLHDFSALSTGLVPAQLFVYANALLLVESLWPRSMPTPLGKLSSDGKLLLQSLRFGKEKAEEFHAFGFVLEGLTHRERREYREARSCFEKGLVEYPNNIHLLNWHANNLLDLREFSLARECYLRLLAPTEKQAGVMKAIMLNNIAYVDAVLGKPELLQEADRYSAAAMADMSWMPAIKGTRGTVLVELGKIEEGIELLREAMQGHAEAHGKAQNACFLAMAEAKWGDFAQSRKYLDEARRLDASCFLLERASAAEGVATQ